MEEQPTTTIHLILDMSGSMVSIGQKEVLGSANKYIKETKKTVPDANIEVIVFDDQYERVLFPQRISDVRKLTDADYRPRGMTALHDAIGKTVQAAQKGRNLFVILTDGLENASREFSAASLKKLIKKAEKAGNQFIFLAANQDAVLVGEHLGLRAGSSYSYVGTVKGYSNVMGLVTNTTADWAAGNTVDLTKEPAQPVGNTP